MEEPLQPQGVEGDEVPKKTFFYRVEYDDNRRLNEHIVEYVAIDGESEFDTQSKAAVGTTHRAGQRLYKGNIAPFSNVSAILLKDSDLNGEFPDQRTETGKPITVRELCLANKLVWGETPLYVPPINAK